MAWLCRAFTIYMPLVYTVGITHSLGYAHTVHVQPNFSNTHMKTDTEEKKVMKKVVIFVFFVHKKCSSSFIKLMLNH